MNRPWGARDNISQSDKQLKINKAFIRRKQAFRARLTLVIEDINSKLARLQTGRRKLTE